MDDTDPPPSLRAPRLRTRLRRAAGTLVTLLAPGRSPADPLNFLARRNAPELAASTPYGDGERRTLDVYRPRPGRADSAVPVVVFFYGGEWQTGHKEMYLFVAATLAARGYLTIIPDYRVYPA